MLTIDKRFGFYLTFVLLSWSIGALLKITYLIDAQQVTLYWIGCLFFGSVYFSNFKIFAPSFVFTFPWICLLYFSALDISKYSRPLQPQTQDLLLWTTTLGCISAAIFFRDLPKFRSISLDRIFSNNKNAEVYFLFFVAFFSLLNIAYSGYVPFLQALISGDSGYLEFGIPSVLGLFYSMANAASLVFFLKYKQKKQLISLVCVATVIAVELLFYSRQNIVFLLLEIYIVNCFLTGFPNILKVTLSAVMMLFFFAYAGEFRSGDIRELVGLNTAYAQIPDALVWLYAYSSFNILNLDNIVYATSPRFDGSSIQQLLPSFLRGQNLEENDLLELSNFNVSSYLSSLYEDIGTVGACVFVVAICSLMSYLFYVRLYRGSRLNSMACCVTAVLLVATAFSFFHNFFFFPPVIFQIIFAPLFLKFFSLRSACHAT